MRSMNDSDLIDLLGGTAAVAKRTGVRPASVSEWRVAGIPDSRRIELGAAIEMVGGARRWEQRPDDWHRIWPELIGTDGAPDVPATREAA